MFFFFSIENNDVCVCVWINPSKINIIYSLDEIDVFMGIPNKWFSNEINLSSAYKVYGYLLAQDKTLILSVNKINKTTPDQE